MSLFSIVLVRPRDPNNIGACARAMGNFALDDLRVVNPYPPVWREAVSAVGADDILKSARVYDTLDEALADREYAFATTALKNREIRQEIITLPRLGGVLQKWPERKTAVVFGNEKSGLCGEDIARCDAVLNIPTAAKQPSINLAQAVLLICYEIAHIAGFKPLREPRQSPLPTREQKEILLREIDRLFVQTDFKTDLRPEHRQTLIRQALSRVNLTRDQLFFLKKLILKINEKTGS